MRGVLFDLDGTLVHTLRDLGGAMNKALEEHNLPGHPTDAYARMIGGGMAKLVERASGGEGEQELLQARLLVHYQHQMVTHTRPYPGIWPVLDELRARGVPCGVVSNKDHKMTVGVVARVFPDGPFSVVRGRQDGVPRKPSPEGIWLACEALGVSPDQSVYVGDMNVDREAAAAAGMRFVGAGWGYAGTESLRESGAMRVLEEPIQLLDVFRS